MNFGTGSILQPGPGTRFLLQSTNHYYMHKAATTTSTESRRCVIVESAYLEKLKIFRVGVHI